MSVLTLPDGLRVDGETGEIVAPQPETPPATDPDVMDAARKLSTAATGVRDNLEGPRREGWRSTVRRTVPGVAAHRDRLAGLLDRGDAWLAARPGAPDRDQRESRWLGWETEYRSCCDALRDAEAVL